MFSKLSQRSLYAGYRSLNNLEDCIQRKGKVKDIEYFCNEFYKNIPHTNPTPLTINTIKLKKEEILQMIQAQAQEQAVAHSEEKERAEALIKALRKIIK